MQDKEITNSEIIHSESDSKSNLQSNRRKHISSIGDNGAESVLGCIAYII